MPRMVRGGGIFEENDRGDLFQSSECSGICYVRIPSGPLGQRPYPFWPYGPFPPDRGNRPLVPKGSLGVYGFALVFCFLQLPAATSQALRASSPGRGALGARLFGAGFFEFGGEEREDFEQVADDAVIGGVEDRGFGVFVDGDDHVAAAHAG